MNKELTTERKFALKCLNKFSLLLHIKCGGFKANFILKTDI